jgi:hypothetical protein
MSLGGSSVGASTYDLVWENPAYLRGKLQPNFAGFSDVYTPARVKFDSSTGHDVADTELNALPSNAQFLAKGKELINQTGAVFPPIVKVPRPFFQAPTAVGQLAWKDSGISGSDASEGVPSDAGVRYSANSSLTDAFGDGSKDYANVKKLVNEAKFHFEPDFTPGELQTILDFPSIKECRLKLVKIQLQFSKGFHGIDKVVLGTSGLMGTDGGLTTKHASSTESMESSDIVVMCDPDKRHHEEHYNTNIGLSSSNISTVKFGIKKFSCIPKHGMCHAGLSAGSQVAFSGLGVEHDLAKNSAHDGSTTGHTQGTIIRAKMTIETHR